MIVERNEYHLMDAAEGRMWWYRALHARVADALARRPGPTGTVLDAGCGTGGMLHYLPRRTERPLLGLEFNPEAASRARGKAGVPIVSGDVNTLPFAEQSFAALLSLDVLCHRAVEPVQALAEFHRVLRPGGTLIVNMPAYDWMWSAHDVRVHNSRRTTARDLAAQLRAAGFTGIEARYWNTLLFPLMVVQRKLLARGQDHASDVGAFPAWLDTALHGVTAIERALGRIGLRYPGGGSILVVATRP